MGTHFDANDPETFDADEQGRVSSMGVDELPPWRGVRLDKPATKEDVEAFSKFAARMFGV